MTISIKTVTVRADMQCDKPGCDNTVQCVTAMGIPAEHAAKEVEDYAMAQGWTVWVIRQQGLTEFFRDWRLTAYKHRCPEHPPESEWPLIHLTKNVSASCFYDHHGAQCDWTMKHTPTMDGVDYRRLCRCTCHTEETP